MGSDHEAEIRASVGAHQDLGSGYDDALAEGLVERIGAEIDKRIEAQLRRYFAAPYSAAPQFPAPHFAGDEAAGPGADGPGADGPGAPRGYPVASGYPPGGYYGYQGPMAVPGYQAPLPRRPAAPPALVAAPGTQAPP